MLVCEGQTEVGYFKYIAQRLRSSGISVKAVHDAVSPMAIVKNAYAYIDGDPKRGIEANQYDQVWPYSTGTNTPKRSEKPYHGPSSAVYESHCQTHVSIRG